MSETQEQRVSFLDGFSNFAKQLTKQAKMFEKARLRKLESIPVPESDIYEPDLDKCLADDCWCDFMNRKKVNIHHEPVENYEPVTCLKYTMSHLVAPENKVSVQSVYKNLRADFDIEDEEEHKTLGKQTTYEHSLLLSSIAQYFQVRDFTAVLIWNEDGTFSSKQLVKVLIKQCNPSHILASKDKYITIEGGKPSKNGTINKRLMSVPSIVRLESDSD